MIVRHCTANDLAEMLYIAQRISLDLSLSWASTTFFPKRQMVKILENRTNPSEGCDRHVHGTV